MALYSKAKNKLLGSVNGVPLNHNISRPVPVRIFVVHIMVGYMAGTDTIFRNPNSEVSAHFGVSRAGAVWQWVDTDDTAWHAFAANDYSIGVEHAGFPNEPLTDAQINATGALLAWANKTHPGIDLWINKRIQGSGIAYHAQYPAWNLDAHTCPGTIIEGQIGDILDVAKKQ